MPLPPPSDAGSLAAALAFGYLLGSIPFGLIVTRLAGLGDIRAIGSGNIGATNVLRTGRKGLAALTLLGDFGKGAVAVLIARSWSAELAAAAGFGAFLGHLFPVWLGFKGGKGVATYLGVLCRHRLARRDRLRRDLAVRRHAQPLFLARRAECRRCHAAGSGGFAGLAGRRSFHDADNPGFSAP